MECRLMWKKSNLKQFNIKQEQNVKKNEGVWILSQGIVSVVDMKYCCDVGICCGM